MSPIKARRIAALSFLLSAAACSDSSTDPEDNMPDRIVEGVNLTRLFAPPTQVEIDAMLAAWAARDVAAHDIEVLESADVTIGPTAATVRIVAHQVAGVRHIGAIITPAGAAPGSLPVLVIAHGGDNGLTLDPVLGKFQTTFGDLADEFVYVVPSFRSEPLTFQDIRYESGGDPSPWDYDVDDALALVNVALETTPEADPERIGVVGSSRGGCVSLLMGIRDPRIDLIVEFSGPTDFFGPFVQAAVELALRGVVPDLPGAIHINETFIQPLKRGEIGIETVRPEFLRRSPVYFASRLPQLQVHHGTADDVVPIGEGERLIQVMQMLGRTTPGFESYIYQGGGHDLRSFPESLERTRAFIGRLVTPAPAPEFTESASSPP